MTSTQATSSSARAAAGAGLLFVSQIVGNALYFLIQRSIISELPKESFGALSFVQQTSSLLLVVLVDAGINNIAIREIIQHPQRERDIVSASLWLRLFASIVSAGIISVFFLCTDASLVSIGAMCIASVSVSARMTFFRSSMELPLRSKMNYGLMSALFVLDTLLYATALWSYEGRLEPLTILSLQFVTSLPGFIILISRVRGIQYLFPLPSFTHIRTLVLETRSVATQLFMQNVHAGIDIFILRFTSTLRELAVFGAVANISVIILTLYNALSTAAYPLLAERDTSSDPSILHARILRSLSLVSFAAMFVASCLSTLAPMIIILFTKNVYRDHLPEFQYQFWCTVAIVIAQFTVVVNTAIRNHRAAVYCGAALVVGSLLFDFALIPGMGTRGMLIAKALSNLLCAGVGLFFLGRVVGPNIIGRYLLRVVSVGTLLVATSMNILGFFSMPVALALTILMSLILGAVSGMVTKADAELFTELVRRFIPRRNPTSIAQE